MQREIDDLRRKLRAATSGVEASPQPRANATPAVFAPPAPPSTTSRKLGETSVSGVVLDEIFEQ